MRHIVGVCGRAGAGKDAFADAFVAAGYVRLKFADPLKQVVRDLFPTMNTREHTDGELKDVVDEATGASPREVMQYLGTELLQYGLASRFPRIGRTVFCGPVLEAAALHERVIITDVRFLHEYYAFQKSAQNNLDSFGPLGPLGPDGPDGPDWPDGLNREAFAPEACSERESLGAVSGLCMVRIERDAPAVGGPCHVSETEYLKIPVDHVVRNDGTLATLHEQARSILEISHGPSAAPSKAK
jgi:hypothetical protein